ncbi:hypothetical protein B9Z55_018675 [Caenorhabditis nigoni]|nr:hypothetical protein B9Z55_018675 [Caenorhabditis nigoni]
MFSSVFGVLNEDKSNWLATCLTKEWSNEKNGIEADNKTLQSTELPKIYTNLLNYFKNELQSGHRIFGPESSETRAIVRIFQDRGHKFVMLPELVAKMEKANLKLDSIQLPKTGCASDVIPTIDFRDIFALVGRENMSKIEFVITPIRRAKHAAVPIPTHDRRYCILAADALIQIMKNLIHAKKVFQISNKNDWKKVEAFVNKVTAYFNGDNVSVFFIEFNAFDEIKLECRDEFNKLNLPVTTSTIREVKNSTFGVDEVAQELKHLNLTNSFPNILNCAAMALEEVGSSRYDDSLQTSDMYAVVEHCQLICMLEKFPKLKSFLHSQKSCNRVLNSNCAECHLSINNKHTTWRTRTSFLRSDEISEYPYLSILDRVCFTTASALLFDRTYYRWMFGEKEISEHEEVVDNSKPTGVIPFVIIGEADRIFYRDLMTDFVQDKKVEHFANCLNKMMRRNRSNVFLRVLGRKCNDETPRLVLKDELLYILPFLLKQQKLWTKENAQKMQGLLTSVRMEISNQPFFCPAFEIDELKELFDSMNIDKNSIVLVHDHGFEERRGCTEEMHLDTHFPITRYFSGYGDVIDVPEALLYLLESFVCARDWTKSYDGASRSREIASAMRRCIITVMGDYAEKNNYLIELEYFKNETCQTFKSLCDRCDDGEDTFGLKRMKQENPEELISISSLIDCSLNIVDLERMYSDEDQGRVRTLVLPRWKVYVTLMAYSINNFLGRDHRDLKIELFKCLARRTPFKTCSGFVHLANLVLFPEFQDIGKPQQNFFDECWPRKTTNPRKPCCEDVLLEMWSNCGIQAGILEPSEKLISNVSNDVPTTLNRSKPKKIMRSKSPEVPEQVVEPKTQETFKEAAQQKKDAKKEKRRKKKEDKKLSKEQKSIDKESIEDEDPDVSEPVEPNTNEELEKVETDRFEKLQAEYKKREEVLKREYQAKLLEANIKLERMTKQYEEDRHNSSRRVKEMKQRVEWKNVEVNRRVDEVTRNMQRIVDAKEEEAKKMRSTIDELRKQTESQQDIIQKFERTMDENDDAAKLMQNEINRLTQQLRCNAQIIQNLQVQTRTPSSSSSHCRHEPTPSTSTPSTSSVRSSGNPTDINMTLFRLKSIVGIKKLRPRCMQTQYKN